MEKLNFTLHENMDLISKELYNFIKENYDSSVYIDNTKFADKYCKCRVDTYQIYSFFERAYITINIYFFQSMIEQSLSVKVSIFAPVNNTSRKCKKIAKEIEKLMISHK